jgi:hypothetical protein
MSWLQFAGGRKREIVGSLQSAVFSRQSSVGSLQSAVWDLFDSKKFRTEDTEHTEELLPIDE